MSAARGSLPHLPRPYTRLPPRSPSSRSTLCFSSRSSSFSSSSFQSSSSSPRPSHFCDDDARSLARSVASSPVPLSMSMRPKSLAFVALELLLLAFCNSKKRTTTMMVFSTSSFSVARGGHKKVLLLQRSIEITTTSSFLPTTKARVWLCGRRRRRRLQSRATFWNLEFVFCICISAYNLLSSVGHTKKIERERERERERPFYFI